jgi:glucosyl-3-phosphoglycerate synthase
VHERAASWFRARSSTWRDWPLERVLADKARCGCRISLVIPARNEADTVAGIVATLSETLQKDAPLLDEIIVIDSDSTDDTAGVAAGAGATVYRAGEIAADLGSRPGKGEALWKSLFVADGDLLVFVDGDLTDWGPHFVTGLLGPLLADDDIQLVRAAYTRIRTDADGSVTSDGGRLTELVARPLLSLYWPELTGVAQPLAGEWAVRRSLMQELAVPVGYGVELSTLLDTAARHGLDAIAQVHLGRRAHRHRSDREMALAAVELLAVAESRRGQVTPALSEPVSLQQFEPTDDGWGELVPRSVLIDERPPVVSVRGFS